MYSFVRPASRAPIPYIPPMAQVRRGTSRHQVTDGSNAASEMVRFGGLEVHGGEAPVAIQILALGQKRGSTTYTL